MRFIQTKVFFSNIVYSPHPVYPHNSDHYICYNWQIRDYSLSLWRALIIRNIYYIRYYLVIAASDLISLFFSSKTDTRNRGVLWKWYGFVWITSCSMFSWISIHVYLHATILFFKWCKERFSRDLDLVKWICQVKTSSYPLK